jgi:hypothetical protein
MMETAPPLSEGTPLDRGLRALCGIAAYYRIGADPVQLARELALGSRPVSEADLIAHGTLRVDQQFVRTLPWPFADWSFAPTGYRPALERGFIVPTFPAGAPLLMALFQRVAGRGAVFYLVPLLGGLCVWMTSALGASVHGRLTGVLAALLVTTSPSFVTELMVPASDVAAAAWWTTALALTIRGGSMAALGAGAAVSVAVLTRPNLVPLTIVVGLFQIWRVVRGDRNAVRALALSPSVPCQGVWLSPRSISTYGSPFNRVRALERCADERSNSIVIPAG